MIKSVRGSFCGSFYKFSKIPMTLFFVIFYSSKEAWVKYMSLLSTAGHTLTIGIFCPYFFSKTKLVLLGYLCGCSNCHPSNILKYKFLKSIHKTYLLELTSGCTEALTSWGPGFGSGCDDAMLFTSVSE